MPSSLSYVPVDFERASLVDSLVRAGLDAARPAWFAWLGVTMYLARPTVTATLAAIGRFPPGTGVVFDYGVSRSMLTLLERLVFDRFAARVAAAGEPWLTFFEPSALAHDLRVAGFDTVIDLDGDHINARYFAGRPDTLAVGRLARLVAASR